MEAITSFILTYGGVIAFVLLAAERLARITPNQTDDMIVTYIRKALRVLGADLPNIEKYESTKTTEGDK